MTARIPFDFLSWTVSRIRGPNTTKKGNFGSNLWAPHLIECVDGAERKRSPRDGGGRRCGVDQLRIIFACMRFFLVKSTAFPALSSRMIREVGVHPSNRQKIGRELSLLSAGLWYARRPHWWRSREASARARPGVTAANARAHISRRIANCIHGFDARIPETLRGKRRCRIGNFVRLRPCATKLTIDATRFCS